MDICVPGGSEKWLLTFKENKPSWVILLDGQQPASSSSSSGTHGPEARQSGTYGPEDALKELSASLSS